MIRVITSYITLSPNEISLPSVCSIPLLTSELPSGRFIGSFGIQGTLLMLSQARRALSKNNILRRVEIYVETSSSKSVSVSTKILGDCDAIHLNMLSPDLRELVSEILGIQDTTKIAQEICNKISLLNILWKDPQFAHCKLFFWNSPYPGNPRFQLAAIAEPDLVTGIKVFNHPAASTTSIEFLS